MDYNESPYDVYHLKMKMPLVRATGEEIGFSIVDSLWIPRDSLSVGISGCDKQFYVVHYPNSDIARKISEDYEANGKHQSLIRKTQLYSEQIDFIERLPSGLRLDLRKDFDGSTRELTNILTGHGLTFLTRIKLPRTKILAA
jgi:hypothetical protein